VSNDVSCCREIASKRLIVKGKAILTIVTFHDTQEIGLKNIQVVLGSDNGGEIVLENASTGKVVNEISTSRVNSLVASSSNSTTVCGAMVSTARLDISSEGRRQG
jgi:hypothetical protein